MLKIHETFQNKSKHPIKNNSYRKTVLKIELLLDMWIKQNNFYFSLFARRNLSPVIPRSTKNIIKHDDISQEFDANLSHKPKNMCQDNVLIITVQKTCDRSKSFKTPSGARSPHLTNVDGPKTTLQNSSHRHISKSRQSKQKHSVYR